MMTHIKNVRLIWLKCKNARTLQRCRNAQDQINGMKLLRNK